jgi:hypothetical protein
MKKEQLAQRLARESGITPAAAADQLDRILNDILKRVRNGESASLPGLGTFWPGPKPAFYFEEGLPSGAQRLKTRSKIKPLPSRDQRERSLPAVSTHAPDQAAIPRAPKVQTKKRSR